MTDHKEGTNGEPNGGRSDEEHNNRPSDEDNQEDHSSSDSYQEVDADADAIGDSAYSKHFLFTTLMNAIKVMTISLSIGDLIFIAFTTAD